VKGGKYRLKVSLFVGHLEEYPIVCCITQDFSGNLWGWQIIFIYKLNGIAAVTKPIAKVEKLAKIGKLIHTDAISFA
jgi:hypothetical protein